MCNKKSKSIETPPQVPLVYILKTNSATSVRLIAEVYSERREGETWGDTDLWDLV